MDKCIRITVILVMASHITSGRSFVPRVDTHKHFHHDFESYRHDQGPHRDADWDHYRPSASQQHPEYYQRENKHNYPHKTHEDKEFWKTHHSGDWDSASWEYPDIHSHESSNSWGHQSWGNHETPNHWPHRQPGPSHPNGQNWNNEKPSSWGAISPPSSASTSRSSADSGSQETLAILLCMRSCPVTSEYNPVCGSNNVTYGNPGRLECAKYCGVDVTLRRHSVCPAPALNNTAAQTQTNSMSGQPNVQQTLKPIEPTRYTTVEVPATAPTHRPAPAELNPPFTISPDVLNSIFTSTTTEDGDWDIDIRTRSRQPVQYVHPV